MRVPIGNDTLIVELPDEFRVEENDDGSTFAYLPGKDFAEVYLSVITITSPVPTESDLGYDGIVMQAAQDGESAVIIDGKSVYETESESRRRGGKRRVHQWYVGYRNFAVVITVTVLARLYDDPVTTKVLLLIPDLIRSIREHNEDDP
jgi:hypothetical protein